MKNIPKVCYLYWNGAKMSYLHALTVISFHKYNPDWRIVVYVSEALPAVDNGKGNPIYKDYTGDDCWCVIENLPYIEIQRVESVRQGVHSILISDIWRREILYERGGLYSDFDVIWLKPMSEFENIEAIGNPSDFEALVSYYEWTHGFHNVSNLISQYHSPFMLSLIEEAKGVHPPYGDQSFGTDMLNRKYPTLETILPKYPRVLAVKYETFYPYSTFNLKQLFVEDDLSPLKSKNVMCVHWFNGNELAKEYINEERYKDPCSMTTILKREKFVI